MHFYSVCTFDVEEYKIAPDHVARRVEHHVTRCQVLLAVRLNRRGQSHRRLHLYRHRQCRMVLFSTRRIRPQDDKTPRETAVFLIGDHGGSKLRRPHRRVDWSGAGHSPEPSRTASLSDRDTG